MSATLDHLLEPLNPWLNDPATEDVAIQKPGEAWVFAHGEFTCHSVNIDALAIENLITSAAAQSRQDVTYKAPILTTDIKREFRLAAVTHPCVAEGRAALTIRRGSDHFPALESLIESGLFRNTRTRPPKVQNPDLISLLKQAEIEPDPDEHNRLIGEFLALAVRKGMNIILAGDNAAGKTHVSKALIGEMPRHLRIITIQDSEELGGMPHPNWVSFYCAKDGITQAELVSVALRFRIGRLFLQEIRDGDAAVALLYGLQTGHRGAITTIHATDCSSVFDRLRFQIKSTAGASMVEDKDIEAQLRALIDIVIHCSRPAGAWAVDEVWFRETAGQ